MLSILRHTLILFATATAAGLHGPAIAGEARPNIVVLLADDLGWGDVSLHGGHIRTPNIDGLARDGIELKRYYAYPYCSPTRAALLTGLMPRRFGITQALGPRDSGLPADQPSLARSLQAAGYQTWLVGKWHLGVASPPQASGFDHFYGFFGPEIDSFRHTGRGGLDWQRNGETVREDGYSTFLFAREALSLIGERDPSRPFFLQLAFNAPHFPFAAPPESLSRYRHLSGVAATRAAMIDALDDSIGSILEAIDENGLRNDTLVVFMSDNGADQAGRNAPFRGNKGSVFEGGIHVPCLLRWPGVLDSGGDRQCLVRAEDIAPTLMQAAAVATPSRPPLDGQSVWPDLLDAGPGKPRSVLIAADDFAVLEGDWKLIETADARQQLFNLRADPTEARNVLDAHPEVAQSMRSTLITAQAQFPPLATRRRPARPSFAVPVPSKP